MGEAEDERHGGTRAAGSFKTVYESRDGLAVRLEVAQRIDPQGRSYSHHRLITAEGHPGGVVIATHGDQVLLVLREAATCADEPGESGVQAGPVDPAMPTFWELPRGSGELVDVLKPHLQTALRELREETGYRGENVELLGSYVLDSSIYPQRVSVVACAVSDPFTARATDGEVLKRRWFEVSEVLRLMAEGLIADAHSLASLGMWFAKRRIGS